jgi:hypothetical protein
MITMLFAGCSVLDKLGLGGNKDELQPVSSVVMGEQEALQLSDKVPIHLYFANEDNTKLKLEVQYVPLAEAKKSTSNLASIIVKKLIEGPSKNSGLNATVPKEAARRGPVAVSAGTATVDLTSEFVSKHPGGKKAEELTIYSIVNSLTELTDIQKVKFTVNGKAQANYKGNFKFDEAFPKNLTLISYEVPLPSSVSTGGSKATIKPSATAKPTATPKATATPKPGTTQKAATPTPKPASVNTQADAGEDSEAVYLEELPE